MTDLKDKVIVVTGASAGNGKSIAQHLVSLGCKVIGCSIDDNGLKSLESSLNGKGPGSIEVIKCDVSKEEDVIGLFKFVEEKFGTLHASINNAGVLEFHPLLTGKTDGWMRMLQVNVMGVAMCAREAVKLMKKCGVDDGHILNINSLLGHKVEKWPRVHFYSVTKHAVTALTEGLRQELRSEKSHIQVTAISPGLVKTEIYNKEFPNPNDLEKFYSSFEPLQPEDIAQAVVYALSAQNRVDISDIYIRSSDQTY